MAFTWAGIHLVAEFDRVLTISSTLDSHIGPVKTRGRGLSAGETVLSVAETMLFGGDFMCDLDFQRVDCAGAPPRAIPQIPAVTTFIGRARRFDDAIFIDMEPAIGELVRRGFAALGEQRRSKLVATRSTIDLDTTDVEVYAPEPVEIGLTLARPPQPARLLRAGGRSGRCSTSTRIALPLTIGGAW